MDLFFDFLSSSFFSSVEQIKFSFDFFHFFFVGINCRRPSIHPSRASFQPPPIKSVAAGTGYSLPGSNIAPNSNPPIRNDHRFLQFIKRTSVVEEEDSTECSSSVMEEDTATSVLGNAGSVASLEADEDTEVVTRKTSQCSVASSTDAPANRASSTDAPANRASSTDAPANRASSTDAPANRAEVNTIHMQQEWLLYRENIFESVQKFNCRSGQTYGDDEDCCERPVEKKMKIYDEEQDQEPDIIIQNKKSHSIA